MRKLRAKLPVLYASRQYGIGDALPGTDSRLVDAWLESGAAEWVDDEDDTPTQKPPKAKPVMAEPGMPGKSSDGDPDALVGKVPKRGKKK